MIFEPYKEERPWGSFERFTLNEPSTIKILTINAGESFSKQLHHHRDEMWIVLSGNGTLELGDDTRPLSPGDRLEVPRETTHRITGGTEAIRILEIARGNFDEDDIVRLEDKYGRTS